MDLEYRMADQTETNPYPCSPKVEIDGIPYFPRMCEKIRLHAEGRLPEDLHENLGIGMDLWTCQFLGVEYGDLREQVVRGASDREALDWAKSNGVDRPDFEKSWWVAFMNTVGFRDRLSQRLNERKIESGLSDRHDIQTMFDYIDADEGR